ncbi:MULTISPECIES: alpha/beta hydrolase [Pseudomonas fluorescens group]|uniref:alpha/beta hydrolase n=1 Tax=Pseudomonas fluorescens group TaxID=136843 RepID=UPI00087AD43B|nr:MULTISPECIES: alpha/beta hydrolase [Pseudomonas fluorescens group]SDU42810.1 Acetyl esterase/lipase [Pseudomonas moraviensis]
MKAHELLDPDFNSFLTPGAETWTLDTLPAIRERVHGTFKSEQQARCESLWTTAHDGEGLRLCLYRPASAAREKKPAVILYLHGGGFVLGRPEMADDYLADLADELAAIIVAVDYRLAPEHPFPIPLEDCYTALGWVFAHQQALNIEADKVIVMGHSAGAGLAAALAILARDRGEYCIASQVLIYPMLDYRSGSSASPHQNGTTGVIGWPPQANQFCWQCLRGNHALDDSRIGWFSPALQEDLSNLPPTFLAVGALDLFLEEDVAFAMRLSRTGVAVELHVYPGAPHMFDKHPGNVTDQSARDIVRSLQRSIASA